MATTVPVNLRSEERLSHVLNASERLAMAGSVDEVVAVLRDTARAAVGAEGIAVVIANDGCCSYVAEDAVSPLWQGQSFAADQSSPGLGTNVELWLPRSLTVLAAEPRVVEAPESLPARGVALLVDDEELVRASTSYMLADLGYRVIEAASGEEAMRLLDAGQPFDLLVTDHLMPGISGTDLAREVRNARPGTAILLVSGYAELEGLDPNLPRLAKPFRKSELAVSLSELSCES